MTHGKLRVQKTDPSEHATGLRPVVVGFRLTISGEMRHYLNIILTRAGPS